MTGLRQLMVSGLCMVVHTAVMILADAGGFTLAGATLLSFVVVVVSGYALHVVFTFGGEHGLRRFFGYVAAMATVLPISAAWLWLFAHVLAWPMVVAAPVGTVATTLLNFILVRWTMKHRLPGERTT